MKAQSKILAALVGLTLAGPALAAVTAEEAAKLKTTLTPLGAERAGNKDGSIPAWDGGYTKVPAGYKQGDARPDPFAAEKPLYSISAKNMAQYADKLTDGVKGLMQKYPDFRIDVYPTHRSAAVPQWVYDNTFKNATRAKLTGGGYRVEGAYGGTPFPITNDPLEIMLNVVLAWRGESTVAPARGFSVLADGKLTMFSEGIQSSQSSYYYKDGSLESYTGFYGMGHYIQSAPASKAGESILSRLPSTVGKDHAFWQYLVGQRRVRRAPAVSYDTPDSVTSGLGFFDEAQMLFGPYDHHEYKLIGKKEIYVPYNGNRANSAAPEDLVKPRFLNPDLVRWELHRVWEIEATLAPGKRHVVANRKYYIDEDTWNIVLLDGWDAHGQLWRTSYSLTLLAPDFPALLTSVAWGTYNLQTGGYFLNMSMNGTKQVALVPRHPESYFSPEELANIIGTR